MTDTKTNEELFKEWEACISLWDSHESTFKKACELKDKEIQRLKKELEERYSEIENKFRIITRQEKEIELLEESNEYYSKPYVNDGCYIGNIDISRCHGEDCEVIGAFSIGGKLARETRAKLQELRGEK